ncbi:hypothetical protein A6M21_11350 [Desulfotomaculum copahuensis]|uniref:Glycosyl transferase family 1 domain-containing protein n=2 Tax=Desulfotomaculum copahuensis TaxID=1838280 RepID=A0A1B7LDP4_9FIRM|nr:hypothetical protein A6M21_11350 [Desulfotomaculum copahuensis]
MVTENDKMLLKKINADINCYVIPNGVNISYFMPIEADEKIFPSIAYVSDMSGRHAIENIRNFYAHIFPLIKSAIPDIKLYLIGRNPAMEILKLSSDNSVVVTGYVDDIRLYLSRMTVFIAPMIIGTGIKNKVLEAMAMAKPIVTTSIGVQGIDVITGRDLIVANTINEFADSVIMLLNDEEQRKSLGLNARKLIEEKYSWNAITNELYSLFNDIINKLPK